MDIKERRLYYASDLHLELRNDKIKNEITIKPLDSDARNFLALCGDIGCPYHPNYEKFLERHSLLYEQIFIIAGNHEYYSNTRQATMAQVDDKIHEVVAKFDNVVFLTAESPFILEDTIIAGCTLWSHVDGNAEVRMRDYQQIYIDDAERSTCTRVSVAGGSNFGGNSKKKWIKAKRRLIRYTDILDLHLRDKTYLEWIVSSDRKVVVLTHHAPSISMMDDSETGRSNIAYSRYYATPLEYLFKPPVVLWISGHTHDCKEIKKEYP